MSRKSRRKGSTSASKIALTPEQAHEVLRLVRDDLVYLQSLNFRSPSRMDVRIASSVLRRLLYENTYHGAWSLAGLEGQPIITAIDLRAVVAELPPRYIQYAYAGGADTEGAQHLGMVLLVIPRAEAEAEGCDLVLNRVKKLIKSGERRAFVLSEYGISPSVVSGGAEVSRIGVIRYVANKLGGVHWDPHRGEWTHPVGGRHRLLDEGHLFVGRLPATFYEVISIAEAIATSEDTARFIEHVGHIAPEPDRLLNVLSFREGRIGKYADMTFGAPKAKED